MKHRHDEPRAGRDDQRPRHGQGCQVTLVVGKIGRATDRDRARRVVGEAATDAARRGETRRDRSVTSFHLPHATQRFAIARPSREPQNGEGAELLRKNVPSYRGTVVATRKDPRGQRKSVDARRPKESEANLVAIDTVDAGVGETG